MVRELGSAFDLGVAGEDLLDQSRARALQPDDEDRPVRVRRRRRGNGRTEALVKVAMAASTNGVTGICSGASAAARMRLPSA